MHDRSRCMNLLQPRNVEPFSRCWVSAMLVPAAKCRCTFPGAVDAGGLTCNCPGLPRWRPLQRGRCGGDSRDRRSQQCPGDKATPAKYLVTRCSPKTVRISSARIVRAERRTLRLTVDLPSIRTHCSDTLLILPRDLDVTRWRGPLTAGARRRTPFHVRAAQSLRGTAALDRSPYRRSAAAQTVAFAHLCSARLDHAGLRRAPTSPVRKAENDRHL